MILLRKSHIDDVTGFLGLYGRHGQYSWNFFISIRCAKKEPPTVGKVVGGSVKRRSVEQAGRYLYA